MTTIRTRLGAVQGIDRGGVSAFLGLPYPTTANRAASAYGMS